MQSQIQRRRDVTLKIRLIAAGLGASLLAAASIAAAQTTQGTDQQASEPQVTALFTRMVEQCTRLMGRTAR
jgi:hypothetical protein